MSRRLPILWGSVAFFLVTGPGSLSGASPSGPRAFASEGLPSAQPPAGSAPQFLGAQNCASAVCHGRQKRASGGSIWRSEYQVWASRDKHFRTFSLLYEERSRAMARRLGLGDPTTEDLCLGCHTLNPTNRTEGYQISDGVSCEACHGPASKWVDSHYLNGSTRSQSLATGLYDTKDPVRLADLCLSCHLGDAQRAVNHDLLAAGHPDLVFELESFQRRMPPHWDLDAPDWEGARRWMIGLAVAFRKELERLSSRISPDRWFGLDFADMECGACHHSLTRPSRRQIRGYEARPGSLSIDAASFVALRQIVSVAMPSETDGLDKLMVSLNSDIDSPGSEQREIGERFRPFIETIDGFLHRLEQLPLDRQVISALISTILADSERIVRTGVRSAEQATLAIETLYAAQLAATGTTDSRLETAIDRLHQSLENYSPERFSEELRRIDETLHAEEGL